MINYRKPSRTKCELRSGAARRAGAERSADIDTFELDDDEPVDVAGYRVICT